MSAVPALTHGLARITVRAPRRRLDVAVPYQVPLAELLPELVRRAGEARAEGGHAAVPPAGWVLRRGDGASLQPEVSLSRQGVRDGDVLYLVPQHLSWPEPAHDDVVEEVAERASARGRTWDAAATRMFALTAAALATVASLATAVGAADPAAVAGVVAGAVGAVLLVGAALLSRAVGDGVVGAAAGGLALPCAAASGALFAGGSGVAAPAPTLLGASALLLASVSGGIAVGHGLRVFVAGAAVAALAGTFSLAWMVLPPAGAASIVVVAAVAGIGLGPLLAVRAGRLPVPAASAAPERLAAERRPDRREIVEAVVRADEVLRGLLLGVAVAVAGCVAILAAAGGIAAPLLGALASIAVLLRSRLFPAVAARLPLLAAGTVGLAVTAVAVVAGSTPHPALAGLGFVAVVALLGSAAMAPYRRGEGSPYLGRLADILDVSAVVGLAPVACAVLGVYAWVRGLVG